MQGAAFRESINLPTYFALGSALNAKQIYHERTTKLLLLLLQLQTECRWRERGWRKRREGGKGERFYYEFRFRFGKVASCARWKFLWRGMHSIGTKRLPQQFVMFSAPQKRSNRAGQGQEQRGGWLNKSQAHSWLANVAN